jgi:outer membrane immunogenic protein
MFKKLVLACVMAFGFAGPTLAADVAVLAPSYAPAVIRPIYSWTGCYAGVNAGGGGAPKSWVDVDGIFVSPSVPGTSLGDHTARGVVGGGQLGCDYQISSFVFGIQGSYDLTGMKGNNYQPGRLFLNNSFVQSVATLTGRIGFTPKPNWLLYGKAGGAWVHDLYNVSLPPSAGFALVPGSLIISAVTNGTLVPSTLIALGRNSSGGWTLGGGVEWAPFGGDWTVSLEYDYMNFGTSRVAFLATMIPNLIAPVDIKQSAQVVLFGLNYHFLGGTPRY